MSDYRNLLKGYRTFLTPQDFLQAAVEYFEWAIDHPIEEQQIFHNKGDVVRTHVNKVRAFTIKGLCNHLNIPESRFRAYRTRDGFTEALEMVDQIIHTQKFENAAAGLLNANLVSRDLGLAERNELSGPAGGPVQIEETSAREILSHKLASIAAKSGTGSDSGGDDGSPD